MESRAANGKIKFETQDIERMVIDENGNVNISGNIASNGKLVCLEDGTNCESVDSSKWIENGSNIYYNGGNVGVGTESPSKRLEVNGGGLLIVPDKSLSYDTPFRIEAVRGGYSDTALKVATSGSGGSISLYEYNSQKILLSGYENSYFNNNYNFGIGTNSPSEKLDVVGNVKISENLTINGGEQVCTAENGLCDSNPTQYVSFISTVDGALRTSVRYLPLGTDSAIASGDDEAAWIIDRDMTITGILWDSRTNNRDQMSAITLMSGSSKSSLSDTSLSKDVQGVVSGSDNTFNVSLSQGDAVVIKYEPSDSGGGRINDLSVTLIGTYN